MTTHQGTQTKEAGLECRVGNLRLAVPVDAVSRLVDYVASALPLGRPGVAIGVHEKTLMVSICPMERTDGDAGARPTKGIVLRLENTPFECVLEVDRVSSFVDVRVSHEPYAVQGGQYRWIKRGALEDDSPIGWVDVSELRSTIASSR